MREQFSQSRTSKLALIAVGLTAAIVLTGIPLSTASAQGGPNPYPLGKSTYWAWQNRPDLPLNLGEARDWNDRAASQGWPVSAYPRTWDVAVFEPGAQGADPTTGHVAVVRQVFDDGTFSATQMDEADCSTPASSTCGRIATRTYHSGPGVSFIHYQKDTRTTWSFAAGAAGWTPANLGAGQTQGSGWYYPLAGGGPQLVSSQLDIPLTSYNTLEIQMAVSPAVANRTLHVYFATASQPDFSPARSAVMRSIADNAMRTYTLYFGTDSNWKGQLVRLRLDPTGPGSAGGVLVQRIRLLNQEYVSVTRFLSVH